MKLELARRRLAAFSVLFVYVAAGAEERVSSRTEAEVAVEEVLVTGQKLERNLQQTVDSVTVISGETLRETGVDDLRDAFRLAPNINYSPSNNGNNGISIRGINSEGVGAPGGNQQPLASMVIDGAAQSLEGVRKGARGVWDLESVEILRGPQISQGRNALAGSVVVKTKDPSFDYEFGGRLGVDTLGNDRAIVVNAPIFDQFAFRFSAESVDKRKSIDYSDPALDFLAEEDFYTLRAKLLFTPTALPNLSALFTWSRAHDDPAITAVSGPNFFRRRLDAVFDGIETRINDVDNFVLDLEYALDSGVTVKSVSTLTNTTSEFGTPSPNFERDETREDRDISQDLRATYSSADGRFSLLAGGFFGDYRNTRDSIVRRLVPEVITTEREVTVDADSCASLDLDADGSGRWYEFFSDVYAQIDQDPDGFFLISSPGTRIGGGANVFPQEGDWDDVGSLLFDLSSLTGVGTEHVPITGGLFDFARYVADDDSILGTYTTNVLVNSGTATFVDGLLSGLQADVSTEFVYDASAFGAGLLVFPGTLSLAADNTFTLRAGNLSSPIPSLNSAWDFTGRYSAAPGGGACPAPGKTVTYKVRQQTPTGRQVMATFQDLESRARRRNYAAYVETDWRFMERLRLISGARYDLERTRYDETNRLNGVQAADKANFDAFLPKLGLVYDLARNASLGFVVSRGYRSGFIDRGRGSDAVLSTVDPEYLLSYEVPLRSLWLGGRLRANANFFYYDWTDQQINVRDPLNPQLTLTRNAGKSESYGVEFDFSHQPIAGLNLGASLGLMKTRFMEFKTDVGDFSGNEFPEAPNVSGALTASYYTDSGWFVGSDLTWQSSLYATSDLANQDSLKVDGRALVNLRGGYEHASGKFRITAELNNALDHDYLTGRDINNGAYVGDPLVAGITAEVSF